MPELENDFWEIVNAIRKNREENPYLFSSVLWNYIINVDVMAEIGTFLNSCGIEHIFQTEEGRIIAY